MSESIASPQPLESSEELDRLMRSLDQGSVSHGVALAELARLVGQQDHFRSRPAEPVAPAPLAAEADFSAFDTSFDQGFGPAASPRAVPHLVPSADRELDRAGHSPMVSVADSRPEQSPDAWARGDGAELQADAAASPEQARSDTGGSRRTLIVLAAVMALTAGGLSASFLAKPTGSTAIASTVATPTILAATGPSKVQPETAAGGADAPSQPSTLLDKNNNDGTATAKVVNTVEQPVDLAQAVKPSAAEAPAVASAFPAPRKVKTVLVRPDGSIIATSVADAPAAPLGDQASLAFDPRTALPIVTRPPSPAAADAPSPASPPVAKPPARTTARAAPSTSPDAGATDQARSSVATPKSKPTPHVVAKPAAPVVVADAAPPATADATPADATPTAASGAFAVQLGAAASEAEGRSTAARLAGKYDLGGATPSVVKADAGGKTVYRIRVGHLSQAAAKALCSKVQAGGGGCFVARN